MNLKLITSPTAEPVSLEEVKQAARLNNDFDDIIPGLIKAAREAAENFQNVVYLTQTWKLTMDELPYMPFKIPKAPLQSIESASLINSNGETVTIDKANFIVSTDSNRIWFKPGKGWPQITLQEFDGVIFTFKAGKTNIQDVSESVKLAIKVYVAHRIDNPDFDTVPEAFYNLLWPERVVPV